MIEDLLARLDVIALVLGFIGAIILADVNKVNKELKTTFTSNQMDSKLSFENVKVDYKKNKNKYLIRFLISFCILYILAYSVLHIEEYNMNPSTIYLLLTLTIISMCVWVYYLIRLMGYFVDFLATHIIYWLMYFLKILTKKNFLESLAITLGLIVVIIEYINIENQFMEQVIFGIYLFLILILMEVMRKVQYDKKTFYSIVIIVGILELILLIEMLSN